MIILLFQWIRSAAKNSEDSKPTEIWLENADSCNSCCGPFHFGRGEKKRTWSDSFLTWTGKKYFLSDSDCDFWQRDEYLLGQQIKSLVNASKICKNCSRPSLTSLNHNMTQSNTAQYVTWICLKLKKIYITYPTSNKYFCWLGIFPKNIS